MTRSRQAENARELVLLKLIQQSDQEPLYQSVTEWLDLLHRQAQDRLQEAASTDILRAQGEAQAYSKILKRLSNKNVNAEQK